MNTTEQFEEILRLASSAPLSERRPCSAGALARFQTRVIFARAKLNATRRARRTRRLGNDSAAQMMSELAALKDCHSCGWKFAQGMNPLRHCTGDFGCALECLRYRSCEWHPELLTGVVFNLKPSTQP